MIGICVEDYIGCAVRHSLAFSILEDFKRGVASPLDDERKVELRCGHGARGSVWPEFRRASRAYATLHGCLVLVDDDRQRFVDSKDIYGVYDQNGAALFFKSASVACLAMYALQERKIFGQVSARFALYRMPRDDYSNMPWGYFFNRGEYVGEQVVFI